MELQDILRTIEEKMAEKEARIAELETLIQTMQQPGPLTGEAVYGLSSEVWAVSRRAAWKDIRHSHRNMYTTMATCINGQFINPMQGLVRTAVELLTDEDLMIEDSSDGWYERKKQLLASAKKLLGEETKKS